MSVIRILFFVVGVVFCAPTLIGQTVTFETENGLTAETICRGTEIQLNLTIDPPRPQGGTSEYNVQWERNINPTFIKNCTFPDATGDCSFIRETPQETTTYRVTVNGSPTGAIIQEVTVTVEDVPNPGLNTTIYLCGRTGVIDLLGELDGGAEPGGTWSNGTGTYDTSDPSGGAFTYTVSGSGVCPAVSAILTIRPCGNNDPDNDGVSGTNDDDKDNDGILNVDEDSFCTSVSTTTPIFILEEDFGFGGPSRSKYSEGLGLTYNPTLPQDTANDGEYNVATSTFLRTAAGNPETFLSTDLIGDVDANGDTDGRYLAINMKSSVFADSPVFVARDLPVNPGVIYDFSMSIASLNNNPGERPANLTIEVVDQVTGTALFSEDSGDIPNGTDQWILVQDSFTAPAGVNIVTIRVINRQNIDGDGNDIGIDNVFLSTNACDFDRDGIPNSEDLDSDNDGIYDIVEAGWGNLDADQDGRIDGGVNTNGVPLAYNIGLVPINSDSDSNLDFLDIDSDNDGIIDNIESQTTAGYIAPGGIDSDFNGVDDTYDTNGIPIVPVNSNTSAAPDYLDSNSDLDTGDCLGDVVEAYDLDQDGVADVVASGIDDDLDGLDNSFDLIVLDRLSDLTNPTNNGTLPTDFPNNHNPITEERDWREEFEEIDETETVEGCSGSTVAFDLFDELTDAAIPGGTWTGPAGAPALSNGERGTFTPGTNVLGVYVYTLPTFGSCPSRTGTVTVNLGTLPNPGTNGTLEVCRNDANSYNLIQSLGGTPDSGGTWTDPNGDPFGMDDRGVFDPENDSAGIYTYTVGTSGCQDTATVEVTINAGADPGEDGAISLCTTDASINLFDNLAGTPDAGGSWTGPGPTSNGDQGSIDPATAVSGDYIYTVSTTACPNPATATVTVSIETTPTLAPDMTSCAADRSTYDITYISNGAWNISITPAGAGMIDAGSSTITDIPAGTNIVIIATNPVNNSCEATLNITAPNCNCPDIVEPIDITTANNGNICFGDANGTLEVQVDPGLTANWYDEDDQAVANGVTTYTPTVTEPGTYRYFVEAFDIAENCASDRIEVVYTIILLEEAEPFVDGKICTDENGVPFPGTALPFIDSGLIGTNYTYQWSYEGTPIAGETGSGISATQAGEYTVTYTDNISGCSDTAFAIVESASAIVPGALTLSLSNGQFASSNSIIASVDGDGDYEYSLDDGPFQQDPVFRNVSFGEHTVRVVDINGCGEDSATIKVFGFPAFFTPNGDGINDNWNVKIQGDEELPPMDINIFDRYGKLMKKQIPTDLGWDGTYNGEPMPSTDYWYSVQLLDGTGAEYRGHFNLRR